jgi:hypothetical protein
VNKPKALYAAQPRIQRMKLKGLYRPLNWACMSCPLSTERLVQMPSNNVEKMKFYPIIPVADEDTHPSRKLENC